MKCQACTQDAKPKQGPVKRPKRPERAKDFAVLAAGGEKRIADPVHRWGLCSASGMFCFLTLVTGFFRLFSFHFSLMFLVPFASCFPFLPITVSVFRHFPFLSHYLVPLYLPHLCRPFEVGYICRRVRCPQPSLLPLLLLSDDHDLH